MQNKARNEDLAFFCDYCHKHGLKITPQRIAVYNELAKARNHPSTEVMYRAVRRRHPNISYDTVNRTLQTFVDIGLVSLVEGIGGVRRFDPDRELHHHFHCRVCGRIFDFHYEEFDVLEIPDHIRDVVSVESKQAVLSGICRRCRSMEPALSSAQKIIKKENNHGKNRRQH